MLKVLHPVFILSIGLVMTFEASSALAAGAGDAVAWQPWEGELTAQRNHTRPYAGVEVDVHFSGPGGMQFVVPAFWDEGRIFRFRAAFSIAGAWQWRSVANVESDPGLHDQRGRVNVASYHGENPLYLHGDLRVSLDRRYLMHADGTPFLWMGDTAWNALWKGTLEDWHHYAGVRARQKFSVVQTVATGTVNRNSTQNPVSGQMPFRENSEPNPAYWSDIEKKISVANDNGLFVLLTGLGAAPAGFATQQAGQAFARYITGRLAGLMVILSPSMDQRIDAQNEDAARRLHEIATHLITQHPGTHLDTSRRYHAATSTDFAGLQSGHHSGDLVRVYTAAREWTLELWHRIPTKPVINIEAMYDARGNNDGPNWREQDVRRCGWIAWLSGSRGYTYGAGDVPPKVPGGSGGVWRFNTDPGTYDYWRMALTWPSATQMTHLRDFIAGIAWWKLVPAPELIRNQGKDPLRQMVASRTADGKLLVAYLPDNAAVTLDLSGFGSASWTGNWFNPLSGKSQPAEGRAAPEGGTTLQKPTEWNDAALVITARK